MAGSVEFPSEVKRIIIKWYSPNITKKITDWKKVDDPEFSEFDFEFPVRHKKELLAVVFVTGSSQNTFQNRFLMALTNILMVAIENKKLTQRQLEHEVYKKEMEIAKKVQNFLFPKTLPNVEKLQVEAFYLPHQDVGGDYYDYIPMKENRFLLCIADVSGKGVPAALLMSNFQASLRTLSRQNMTLEEMVRELNLTTYNSGNAENFITFFAIIYNFSNGELEYVNCGHNEIIFQSKDEVRLLNEGTTVLGIFDPLPFLKTKKIRQQKHFFIFSYTDGLTEVFGENEKEFGFDRLLELVCPYPKEDLNALHNAILHRVNDFKGSRQFSDDITMLSCRVKNQ